VAKKQCNGKEKPRIKQVTAAEVHQLVRETLQEHFRLDMTNRNYEAQDIWDVLIAASVERVTVEMASGLLEDAPCGNTVRSVVKEMLADAGHLAKLEASMNTLLVKQLPKKLLQPRLPGAIDITEIPYHGQHEEDEEMVRRGRAKSGTTHFHCFATLYVVKKNKRYTLAITLMRRSDKALDVLRRLLGRGQTLNLRLKRLYLDRGFDNNGIVAYLKQQPFPTIIPLVIRGKTGGTRALLVGRKSYHTTYTRRSITYGQQTFPVHVVCIYSKGRYRRRGLVRFAYIVIGQVRLRPRQIADEYRRRFGIETSYRLMNKVRARTTSRSAELRLFFVTLAFLLLNLWSYVKWSHLFIPKRGPRQILHQLLPLARWRLWLWEMVKQRLGFSLVITIPLDA
jgi:putative transposase